MAASGFAAKNRELVFDESPAAAGEDGREAGETCPLLLVIVGRESSDAAAVRSDGATAGGSRDPSRVEPPVVAMKKSIPGKTPKEAVSEESGASSGDNGFRGLLEGRFGADDPSEEKVLFGRKWVVYFHPMEGQKLIPVKYRRRIADSEENLYFLLFSVFAGRQFIR